jgi:hypothetical protein
MDEKRARAFSRLLYRWMFGESETTDGRRRRWLAFRLDKPTRDARPTRYYALLDKSNEPETWGSSIVLPVDLLLSLDMKNLPLFACFPIYFPIVKQFTCHYKP